MNQIEKKDDRKEKKEEFQKSCCSMHAEEWKKKSRTPNEQRDLINRLSRIEGQVRGVKKMVEEGRYCVDILTQISAIQSALNSFNKQLLGSHIRTCVVEHVRNGEDEIIDELCQTIQKLMR